MVLGQEVWDCACVTICLKVTDQVIQHYISLQLNDYQQKKKKVVHLNPCSGAFLQIELTLNNKIAVKSLHERKDTGYSEMKVHTEH